MGKLSVAELEELMEELDEEEEELKAVIKGKKKPKKLKPRTLEEAVAVKVDEEENGTFAGYKKLR